MFTRSYDPFKCLALCDTALYTRHGLHDINKGTMVFWSSGNCEGPNNTV